MYPTVSSYVTRTPNQRRRALTLVKGGHTLIFVALGGCILETVRAGITGRQSRLTRPAILATFGEGVILAANGNRCPLTGLAEDLGADDGRVSDIFLPSWFARHIPSIGTALFGFGLGRLIERQSDDAAQRPDSKSFKPAMAGVVGNTGA
jgi:hypothetical protein